MPPYSRIGLPHFDDRPDGIVIDTLIIHSIYTKSARTKFSLESCIRALNSHKVSAHYLISRRGRIINLVADWKRAWHAGASKMPRSFDKRQRDGVNAFSLGVELIGDEQSGFTTSQYKALAKLTLQLIARHSIRNILGHNHIAPGRKVDPPDSFDWALYSQLVKRRGRFLRLKIAKSYDSP